MSHAYGLVWCYLSLSPLKRSHHHRRHPPRRGEHLREAEGGTEVPSKEKGSLGFHPYQQPAMDMKASPVTDDCRCPSPYWTPVPSCLSDSGSAGWKRHRTASSMPVPHLPHPSTVPLCPEVSRLASSIRGSRSSRIPSQPTFRGSRNSAPPTCAGSQDEQPGKLCVSFLRNPDRSRHARARSHFYSHGPNNF